MLDGLRKIADGVAETVNSVNPLVDDITVKHEEMIAVLLDNGFEAKDITSLVDLDRAQYLEFIDLEIKVRERLLKNSKK